MPKKLDKLKRSKARPSRNTVYRPQNTTNQQGMNSVFDLVGQIDHEEISLLDEEDNAMAHTYSKTDPELPKLIEDRNSKVALKTTDFLSHLVRIG